MKQVGQAVLFDTNCIIIEEDNTISVIPKKFESSMVASIYRIFHSE